jgi:hypothetical protein
MNVKVINVARHIKTILDVAIELAAISDLPSDM